ncbi:P-II family nitrogen regulator [Salsuginibacillus kocurii]|uniref:P-II family nitrogen regulator n=1 Tax=Salsuginibacillus kocurii TaxID=427078 RepID=UPI00036A1520|nr:P-II family nitrogen regulator [Salsuginibacillus kocurii]
MGVDPNVSLMVTIVAKGKASKLVKAAKDHGAEGATILNGRGTGIHEYKKLFGMEVQPEKEIILILVPDSKIEEIRDALREEGNLDEPGTGIGFVVETKYLFGINHELSGTDQNQEEELE